MPENPHPPREKTPHEQKVLQAAIRSELDVVEAGRRALDEPVTRHGWQAAILICCVLANALAIITRPDYVNLFVAASFYLNMGYFITLLIPTSPGTSTMSLPEISRFQSWLMENGIRTSTSRFTRVFINAFFMNSRALSLGIGLLFLVDICLVCLAYLMGLPLWITLAVIGQSAIIIAFYALVWKIEPFSSRFEQNIDLVKNRLSRDLPAWVISTLFLSGFLVVVLVFLTTIILLPGMTLNAFLTSSGLTQLAYIFVPVGLLAVSQYFIIRTIHGETSRVMARRLLDHREDALRDLLESAAPDGRSSDAGPGGREDRYQQTSALLESRIYVVRKNTLLGLFPVFVVDLDFSVLLDSTTRTVIRGYIRSP